jgi:hypothetical protein
MRRICTLWLACCLYGAASLAQQTAPIPDAATLLKQVADHQRQLDKTRENYTWRESIVTRILDKRGQVTKTESAMVDVFFVNTHEIRRLVQKDGKDLSPDEQKKEQDRIVKEIEKAQNTPPGEPLNKNAVSITRVLGMMKTSKLRRETVGGRSDIVFDFTGDPHAKTHGAAEDASKKMSGTLWVDAQDREVRRLVARLDDNFHLGFGMLSVGKGSNFTFDQKLVNGELWLPIGAQAHIVAHAFGLIGYRADITIVDSKYQRYRVQTKQAAGAKVAP